MLNFIVYLVHLESELSIYFTYIISFNSHQPNEIDSISISILQMKKLRFQGHMASTK